MDSERRHYLRYKLELEAKILTPEKNISGIVTDIGKAGIGIISEVSILTGTRVFLCPNLPRTAVIHGIVVWVLDTQAEKKHPYMTGVEILKVILPDRSQYGYEDKAELIDEMIAMLTDFGAKIEPK